MKNKTIKQKQKLDSKILLRLWLFFTIVIASISLPTVQLLAGSGSDTPFT